MRETEARQEGDATNSRVGSDSRGANFCPSPGRDASHASGFRMPSLTQLTPRHNFHVKLTGAFMTMNKECQIEATRDKLRLLEQTYEQVGGRSTETANTRELTKR
jgi:hypothetical protein